MNAIHGISIVKSGVRKIIQEKYDSIGAEMPDSLENSADQYLALRETFRLTHEEICEAMPEPPKTYEITIRINAQGSNNKEILADAIDTLASKIDDPVTETGWPSVVVSCQEVETLVVSEIDDSAPSANEVTTFNQVNTTVSEELRDNVTPSAALEQNNKRDL